MVRYPPLPYLPAMFGACMLFMSIYLGCLAIWTFWPDLPTHALLALAFPQFELLTMPRFFYGLVASALYGWFVAIVFVFFYSLWRWVARAVTGDKVIEGNSSPGAH
ncbi:MAG TPA: hypothetical protein VG735_15170 [Caulobacterales bacterium]|nr:hypothetical protein [Caulobacterales bacterium]